MDLLRQLGDLFLSAVPTVIILYIFYFIFRRLFFLPLLGVMAKRETLIEGSQKQSESLAATVQEKQRTYRDGLRQARAKIFAEQDIARRAALDERTAAIRDARTRATEQVHAAKARLAGEVESARKSLDASGQQLADDMARAVLEPAGGAR
jgi:F0F1-type ATP synthase membrane subunit b/b'